MTSTETQKTFETNAYDGYVSAGIADTDGYYAPEGKQTFVRQMRRSVPLTPDYFRYNSFFRPSAEDVDAYNATFKVNQGWKPDHLDLAVRWDKGWKTYSVTGTRHAYYLLRKLARRDDFEHAMLNDFMVTPQGYRLDNIISLNINDITGRDQHGKYRALLNRNNSHYDLERDDRNLPTGARSGQRMAQYGG